MITSSLKQIITVCLVAVVYACSSPQEKTSASTLQAAEPSGAAASEHVAVAEQRTPADTPEVRTVQVPSEPTEAKTVAVPLRRKMAPVQKAALPLTKKAEEKAPADDNAVKGEMLIAKSDCVACHHPQEKLIGPSYAQVAGKYERNTANAEYLIGKIIKGGSGVWGEVFMAPHPALSEEDARAMVDYILSVK